MHLNIRISAALLFALILSLGGALKAQLTVNGTPTDAQLATLLTGPGVVISNVTHTWANGSAGSFNGVNSTVGLNSGVLLTSGTINIAAQANLSGSEGIDNNFPGDTDLDNIGGQTTYDACILEFDLVAICDTISISYVFGSDEYDEFVCAGVNDVFGFIINGPGLNNVNIATVPATNDPVSINTINNGSVGTFGFPGPGCILGNAAYYTTNSGTTYEYDGRTVPMLAKTWVQPCSTYHIKLAIADGGDGIYDSGVFLEEGGIRCASAQIEVNTTTIGNSPYIVEGCTDGLLYFTREGNLSQNFTLQYSVGGTATNGTDFPLLSGSITFPPGIDSIGTYITPPDDGLVEGSETIYIIISDSLCSVVFADTASFLVVDPPVAAFSYVSACLGSPTPFTDNSFFYGGITSWTWDFGDGSTSNAQNPSHAYTSQGTFTVQLIVETAEGCRDTMSQVVTALESPTAAFTASSFCIGYPTLFSDGSSQLPPGQVVGWEWDFGDGNNSSQQNPSNLYAAPGTYSVQLIATNGAGCKDTVAQSIEILANPQPEFAWANVCQGSPMAFTDQTTISQGSITNWSWDLGNGITTTQQNPSYTYPDTGSYYVTLVVVSDQGCIDSVSHTVEVYSNPEPAFEVDFACLGDSSHFTDLSAIDEGSISSWAWDFGDGGSSSDQNPVHLYTNSGNFIVTLTLTSDLGCTTILREQINRPPSPNRPIVTHDTICTGETAQLQALPATSGDVLYWYYTPTGTVHFQNGTGLHTEPLAATRPWFVQALSDEGCWSERVPVIAFVVGPPQLSFDISSYQVEIPNAIVEFNVFDPATVSSFLWQFGDGGSSTMAQPVYQYQEAGSYLVTLYVTGPNGCSTTYTLGEVLVEQNIRLFIPNAFSPNNDGLNDFFEVDSRLVSALEISIFDRWGRLIYNSQDLGFRWPGTDPSGQPLPEGAYTYKVHATGTDGSVIDRAGTVTILR